MTTRGEEPLPVAASDIEGRARGGRWTSLLIGLCCFVVYNANLRSISAGDTYPARYLPFAIVEYHTVFLEPVAKVAAQERGDRAYWMLPRPDGHIISLYPVVLPLLISPLYVPAVAYLHHEEWTDARLDHVAKVMEKLTASFLAALSAALFYLLLRRRTTPRIALLLTIAYAFGTTTWMIASQALWQHGIAELLVIGVLLILTAPSTVTRVVVAGVLLGLIAGNRPPDVVIAAALGVYGLVWAGDRRRAVLLTITAALPMLAVLAYNLDVAGNVGGGYGVIGKAQFFNHNLLTGISGLLVSPTKGLLALSPFLVFLVLAWRFLPRGRDERRLTLTMGIAVALQIVLYAKTDWRGGLSWGPRYMTDLLPFLVWMLVPVVAALSGVWRTCFRLTVGVAIAFEALGAFSYSGFLDMPIYAADRGVEVHDMRAAFDVRNAPYVTSLRNGLEPADLFDWRNIPLVKSLRHGVGATEPSGPMRGAIDAIEIAGRATTVVTIGQTASITGWALAGDATPAHMTVSIDGGPTMASSEFFDRPDVRRTLNAASPAGWRVPLNTSGLSPGVHRITAFAWASNEGTEQFLAERQLTVLIPGDVAPPEPVEAMRPADLNESARIAAQRVREHQQEPGYWLTAFTSGTRFRDAQPEMNTFLTAILVDLLTPVAASRDLEPSLQRARQHLTSQIEAGGLVRYHGLPDGPGIGTLGCAITPDTDNTALVWRLAPDRDRSRLATALATINRYRTADGLYRTWLAARADYQCLDPGKDPDPADIVIQMHLLQLLSEARPPAARALCQAIRSVANADRVWVYYQKTPLLPMLRLADMRRAGCALDLPESRMGTEIPEQRLWISVVRLLRDGMNAGSAVPDAALMRAVLREFARDDFALIRTNPPLLYHNDLTASVSRYYWSEDVGYALWLRLYSEFEQDAAQARAR